MVRHPPIKHVQNHLEHNHEKNSYAMQNDMNPLNLLQINHQYYLMQESKHIVTYHLLHLLPEQSLANCLLSYLELYIISSDVLSYHSSNTLSFQFQTCIFPFQTCYDYLGFFLTPFVFPCSPWSTHYLMSDLCFFFTFHL